MELERCNILQERYISAFIIPFGVGLVRHTNLCTIIDFYTASYLAREDMLIKPLTDKIEIDLVTLELKAAPNYRGAVELKKALTGLLSQESNRLLLHLKNINGEALQEYLQRRS